MYAVTREPGKKIDQLILHGIQKHIVVVLRGKYYKIHVVDDKNNIYTVEQLTKYVKVNRKRICTTDIL